MEDAAPAIAALVLKTPGNFVAVCLIIADPVFAVSPLSFPEIETGIFSEVSRYAAGEVERVIATPQYRFAPVKVTQRVHVIYLISPAK